MSGVSDESRLAILAAAEREEARLHAEYDAMGTRETAVMISGLRLSMLAETDPMKRAILRGAFLSALRYVGEFWRSPNHERPNLSTPDEGTTRPEGGGTP